MDGQKDGWLCEWMNWVDGEGKLLFSGLTRWKIGNPTCQVYRKGNTFEEVVLKQNQMNKTAVDS